ncbi:MAG: lysophospholipid acyltransferase family protein [Candidatus Omnitrophica bacterium]|nr:lysophospholipid acyltransferase family protein [Candidatus Omnitrophota bacterium]
MFFKICFRYRVTGSENIPARGPFIIASNHASFLDPPAAGLITWRKVCFLAKADLYNNPLFKWWGTRVGVIPISRSSPTLGAIKGTIERLKKGYIVALFPEGTRSDDGSIKDPKGGVGFLAAKANAPVLPVLIKGSDNALPRHAVMFRLRPIEVMVGKPISERMYLKENGECDYKSFSKDVMDRIRGLSDNED